MRFGLTLVAVATLPLLISGAALYVINSGAVPTQALTVLVAVGALAIPVIGSVSRPLRRRLSGHHHSSKEVSGEIDSKPDPMRDWLTGLGNYRAFHEEFDRQLEWYAGFQVPFALLLIDLDDLKLVNESDGHAAGDEMLRDMGKILQQSIRYADRAFRIGGDEFALLMPHTDGDGALRSARRLQERAGNPEHGRPISFSGGISFCPQLATTRQQIYAQAEAALYWCKRHGRSSVDVFRPVNARAGVEPTRELTAALARVISESRLRPVYQPIVDLVNGRVIGYEGLIRPSPGSGFADPASMFIAAASVGRTVELDRACLEAIVAGAHALPADQLLTVNISPRTIEAPQFSSEGLVAILTREGIEPQRVIVELTERDALQDVARVKVNLTALQRAGVRIAADDVGAGNSGLRLLSQFRFDIVKVDLSLVQAGAESASSQAVLRSLRDLAGRWGASVIAEGLETTNQLRTVRGLGISAGQGYLLGRPMADPSLKSIDLSLIEIGGIVLERRASPAGSLAAETSPAA